MSKQAIINEIKREGINTHKILERVPLEAETWKPHDKSRDMETLGRHIANLYKFIPEILENDDLDFGRQGGVLSPLPETKTGAELAAAYDEVQNAALAALEKTSDEEMEKPFTLRRGETIFNSMPKSVALRNLALNHLVHHRGQLGVYLRLKDIPIPGMYGPSADEQRG